ncbi:MAG: hypothetical protein ACOC44_16765 [Promethearchaeia archaeon]
MKEWGVDGFENVNTYFRDPRIKGYCVANDLNLYWEHGRPLERGV